jgi:hypothetical protein
MGDDVHGSIASSAEKVGEKNRVGNACDRPASPFESQVRRSLATGWRLEMASGKDLPSPEPPTCAEYTS